MYIKLVVALILTFCSFNFLFAGIINTNYLVNDVKINGIKYQTKIREKMHNTYTKKYKLNNIKIKIYEKNKKNITEVYIDSK